MRIDDNGIDPPDFNRKNEERFDDLMNKYLERKATGAEKAELHGLVDNGFGARFEAWIDKNSDAQAEVPIPEKLRKEVLYNILGDVPGKTIPMRRWMGWAAAIILTIGAVAWLTNRSDPPVPGHLTELPTENKDGEWVVAKGKQFLHLPDGSSVLMNVGSELRYSPELFASGQREVSLKGEAYFDITHRPGKAFQVITGSVLTRVLGTAFNVNMKQKEVVVTVARGLVEVRDVHKVFGRIKPDEQITVNTETQQSTSLPVSAEQEIAWKKTHLVFDNIDLQEVSRLIQVQYGVELVFVQKDLIKCRVTASFLNNEDLSTVLKVLSEMMGASFIMDGHKVLITGGACN